MVFNACAAAAIGIDFPIDVAAAIELWDGTTIIAMPDDADTNVLEFATPAPREEEPIPFRCTAACRCWPMAILLLQAWMPSYHV